MVSESGTTVTRLRFGLNGSSKVGDSPEVAARGVGVRLLGCLV